MGQLHSTACHSHIWTHDLICYPGSFANNLFPIHWKFQLTSRMLLANILPTTTPLNWASQLLVGKIPRSLAFWAGSYYWTKPDNLVLRNYNVSTSPPRSSQLRKTSTEFLGFRTHCLIRLGFTNPLGGINSRALYILWLKSILHLLNKSGFPNSLLGAH